MRKGTRGNAKAKGKKNTKKGAEKYEKRRKKARKNTKKGEKGDGHRSRDLPLLELAAKSKLFLIKFLSLPQMLANKLLVVGKETGNDSVLVQKISR